MKTNIKLKVYKSFASTYIKCHTCNSVMDYKGKPFALTYDNTRGFYISFADYKYNIYEHIDIEDLSTLSEEEYFQESLVWDLEFPMSLVHKMIVLIKETKPVPNGYEDHIIEY
ncbi:hypothetical protein EcMJ_080 [Escherichia phage vB_Ec-M-J]|nr:hypothetical protein EcMJ_080 [Escherichia phage vB_Ec-M-J]